MIASNLRLVSASADCAVHLDLPGLPGLADGFSLPFASGRHPDTDAIEAENLAWLQTFGLMTAGNAGVFRRARFHDLAGRVYHRYDREALRLTADFIAALFVLDDLMDTDRSPLCRDAAQARAAVDVIRRAARTGQGPEGPVDAVSGIASAMADLTRRLIGRSAPLEAYLGEVDAYLDGVIEETTRRERRFSGVQDYSDVRVAFSAVYACIELGLALTGQAFPTGLRPLARAANLSVSWVNDVFSWPKERALGEPSNLVQVLMDHRGLSEREAFHEACRSCDEVVSGYLDARRACGPEVGGALDLLECWMRGNYDWHAVGTARYRDHLSVAPPATSERTAA